MLLKSKSSQNQMKDELDVVPDESQMSSIITSTVNETADGFPNVQAYNDEMDARYERFLNVTGLTRDFCQSSDSLLDSSEDESDPEEFERFLQERKDWEPTSDESESEFSSKVITPVPLKPASSDKKYEMVLRRTSNTVLKKPKLVANESNIVKTFKCEICKKILKSKAGLRLHLNTHKNLTCDVLKCQKKYETIRGLLRHKESHNDKKRPFVCFHCTMRFHSKKGLTAHLTLAHSKNQASKKKQCSSSKSLNGTSSQQSRNSKHPEKKLNEDTGKKFQCKVCSMRYKSAHSLRRHCKNKHSRADNTAEWNKLKCPICQKCFRQSCLQMQHLQNHSAQELTQLVDRSYVRVFVPRIALTFEPSDDDESIDVSE